MIQTAPVCRNCKHFRPDRSWTYVGEHFERGVCLHPAKRVVDIVTGDAILVLARDARNSSPQKDAAVVCGPKGALYEKETNPVAKFAREATLPEPAAVPLLLVLLIFLVVVAKGMPPPIA